jgi:putative ABC transport system permease protein
MDYTSGAGIIGVELRQEAGCQPAADWQSAPLPNGTPIAYIRYMLNHLSADFRLALRNLRRNPGFAVTAVLALGLGIGANAAIFSAVNALLLGAMPYGHPDTLVAVWEDMSSIGFPHNTPAPANFVDWRRMNSVFTDMAAYRWDRANITGSEAPELISGRRVMPNLFDVLESKPMYGRTFSEEEVRNNARVVVVSYGLWKRRFGGSQDLARETLLMDNETYQVIGVMPPAFAFPDKRVQYWRPLHFTPEEWAQRRQHFLEVIARLKPGVTVQQARANMTHVAGELEKAYPVTNAKLGAAVLPIREAIVGDTGTALRVLFIAAGFVLLIACLNIANLVLARSLDRRREFAVRAALGAGRRRLIGQLLTESLVLSILGAVCGLALAYSGVAALGALVPADIANASTLSVDGNVLGFALLLTILSAIAFGLAPALAASGTDLNDSLKQGGRTQVGAGSHLLRDSLVVSQVAGAMVLLIGAGLMIQTLMRLQAVDTGFRADHLLTMGTNLPRTGYEADEKRMAFLTTVQDRVRRLPGVMNAGFASDLPFQSIGNTTGFRIEGRPEPPNSNDQDALYREVTPGYLESLQARLIEGRLLDEHDRKDSTPVIVINETFAHQYWPSKSPLGDRMRFGLHATISYTVVGVIADVRERGLQWAMKPGLYVPAAQVHSTDASNLVVRTSGDPASYANAVRDAIWSVDKNVPVVDVLTMNDYMELEVRAHRHQMLVLAVFAGIAVFLSALGIYGVLAYSVTERRREIGVRMALGADRASVTGMVMRHGFQLTLAGVAAGAVVAFAGTQLMASLLFGVKPKDPFTFCAVAGLLTLVALASCFGPAYAASRVDPMRVLQEE